jgi:hypothetical protein
MNTSLGGLVVSLKKSTSVASMDHNAKSFQAGIQKEKIKTDNNWPNTIEIAKTSSVDLATL